MNETITSHLTKDLDAGLYPFNGEKRTYEPEGPSSRPTEPWPLSTPEEQGVDSVKLLDMVKFYQEQHAKNEKISIDSITIVRNGRIVADLYLNPLFPKDIKHVIHSCTKSIVSILTGIATDKGYIKDVDVPVLDILDDVAINNRDARLNRLTLADLLTMQTGLNSQDSYLYQWRKLFEMQKTADWTSFILNLPFDVEPGTRYDYSNMSSFLLSAIVAKATGTDTLSFAKSHLFEPLGIEEVKWEQSPQGIHIGWARMWLKPHDMAKIGRLYLHNGMWNNQQIVSAEWVKASTTAHSFPKKYRRVLDENGKVDYKKTIGHWLFTKLAKPFSDGYGYQWWLDKRGIYSAVGVGGQYIMVVPQENMIVVFTSKLSGADSFFPIKLLNKYILTAIVATEAIPANEAAQRELALVSEVRELGEKKTAVSPLPPIAKKISGKSYALEANPWNHDNFRLQFDLDSSYAEFDYTTKERDAVHYQIGLDNIHRLSESNGDTYAAVGSWTTPNTFCVDYELVGYSNRGKWRLTFTDDEIAVEEVGVTGEYSYRGKAT